MRDGRYAGNWPLAAGCCAKLGVTANPRIAMMEQAKTILIFRRSPSLSLWERLTREARRVRVSIVANTETLTLPSPKRERVGSSRFAIFQQLLPLRSAMARLGSHIPKVGI